MKNTNSFLFLCELKRICVERLPLKSLMLIFCCFVFVTQAYAQEQITVSGTVVDESGEPIIGASISLIDGKLATMTGLDGEFTLNVPPTAMLKASYLGYSTINVPVKNQKTLNIVLKEDTRELDAVIVVGYGNQRIKDVTTAAVPVDMQKIADLPVSSIVEGLRGQMSGVSISGGSGRPGELANMSIRQTFNFGKDAGNNSPLVVIDDVVQVDEKGAATLDPLNALDPSEIESMTVLKDGSAAIYGARAAQGAIVVKTKRGKEGRARISYSGKVMWNDAVSHTKTMDAYEYGVFANSFLRANARSSNKVEESKNLFSEGPGGELEQMKSLDYNWLDKAWSSSLTTQHSVNVSGGGDKATYFAGASMYDQGANMGNQNYKKYTYRTGVDVKVATGLTLSASVAGNISKQRKSFTKTAGGINDGSYGSRAAGEQADYGILAHMPKYIPWSVNLDGEDYWVSPSYGPHRTVGNQNVANQMAAWNYFSNLDESGQTSENNSLNVNFSMKYEIPFLKGLSVKGTYATSRSNDNDEQVQMPYVLARAKKIAQNEDMHLYSAHPNASDWDIRENNKSSRVSYNDRFYKNEQMNFFVNYGNSFGKHNVTGMFGVERSENEAMNKRVLYNNPIAGNYNGTSNTAGDLDTENSYVRKAESGTMSYIGRITYNYDSRYLAQFLFRSDASTKFDPRNYWGFFPSLSLGWVTSEETWFKENVRWVDYFKTRLSIGKTGKDNIDPWRWKTMYSYNQNKGLGFGNDGGKLKPSLTPDGAPNPNAKWDDVTKWNLGFDFNVLDNRLSVTYDFYYDQNADMFTDMASAVGTPISIGGALADQNYAEVDAWGHEFSVKWRDKVGDVKYDVGVNFGFGDNKIKKYPNQAVNFPEIATTGRHQGTSTFFPIWGYKVWKETSGGDGILRTDADIDAYWNYLETRAQAVGTTPQYFDSSDKSALKKGMLAYQDLNGTLNPDGSMTGPDGRIMKNGGDMAKLKKNSKTYGFTTNLGASWRNLSVSAQIATSWGGLNTIDYVKQSAGSQHMLWAHESYLTDMYDEDNNVNGRYPNLGYYDVNAVMSDYWKVSSFRCVLRNMSIGYSLPPSWLAKAKIATAKVSLSGNNLWDFYNPYPKKYRNMYDNSFASYPTLRTWALGLNLSF